MSAFSMSSSCPTLFSASPSVVQTEVDSVTQQLQSGDQTWHSILDQLRDLIASDSAPTVTTALAFIAALLSSPGTVLATKVDEAELLVQFFSDRLRDGATPLLLAAAVLALRSLAAHAQLPRASLLLLLRALMGGAVQVQSLAVAERKLVYEGLTACIDRAAKELGDGNFASEVVYGVLGAAEGETNPGCLDIIFNLWPKIINGFQCPELLEDIFEVISAYFPIDFNPGKSGASAGVTRTDLSQGLHTALASTDKFSLWAVPLFMEKLSSDLVDAKVDSLRCLLLCMEKYNPVRLEPHLREIWNGCKQEIMGIRENTSKEVVRLAFSVIRAITAKMGSSIQSPENRAASEKWLTTLIWADLKPFLRFLESGLMETAVEILAAVSAADKCASEELMTQAMPVLVEVCSKAEDKGRVLDMITRILSSTPTQLKNPDYSPSVLGLCTRSLERASEVSERGSAARAIVAAHKSLTYGLLGDAIMQHFSLAASDPGFLPAEDRALLTSAAASVDLEKVISWAKSASLERDGTLAVATGLCVDHANSFLPIVFPKVILLLQEKESKVPALSAIEKICKAANCAQREFFLTDQKLLTVLCKIDVSSDQEKNLLRSTVRNVVLELFKGSEFTEQDIEIVQPLLDELVVQKESDSSILASALCALPMNLAAGLNMEKLLKQSDRELPYKVLCSFLNKSKSDPSFLDSAFNDLTANANVHWLTKALLMRGHKLAGACVRAAVNKFLSETPLTREGLDRLLLVCEEDSDLRAETSHRCLPFYRQRFFQTSVPDLLKRFYESENGEGDLALEAALRQARLVPKSVTESVLGPEVPRLAKTLFKSSSSGISPATSSFLSFLKNLDSTSPELSEVVIPFLLESASSSNAAMGDRITALNALEASASEKASMDMRKVVVAKTAPLLGHKKRLVRKAAAGARNLWILLS